MHTSLRECEKWCFEKLKINKTEDFKEIKKAFREQIKIHHPDKEGGSEEAAKEIMFAFDFLTNEEVRKKWSDANVFDINKLAVILNTTITFEEAFFGVDCAFNYSVNELDKDANVTKKELIEIETLKVKIPPGSFSGYQVNFENIGYRFENVRGVTQVNVSVLPHKKFQVDQMGNVYSTEQLDLNMMLSGGKISVLTMFGTNIVKIPPATRPGEKIIIKGKGFAGTDHIITIAPLFPTKEELKEDKWSNFKVDWGIQKEIDDEVIESFRKRVGGNFSNFSINGVSVTIGGA